MWLRGLLLKLERYGIKGNILQWIGSYISAREQQVIIENVISGKGNLKAEVSQGSILGPLFFLIFINDIADETIGLCRMLADDTSIGEKSYEMNSLCNMPDKPPLYFSTGIIIANILHARLRQKCSSLKCDRREYNYQGLNLFPKVSTRNLLVLNIQMEKMKYFEHKINLRQQ